MARRSQRRLDITQDDAERIFRFGQELNEITNGLDLRRRIMEGLNSFFPGNLLGLNEVDIEAGHARVLHWPHDPAITDLSERVARNLHRHPIVQYYRREADRLPTRMSRHVGDLSLRNDTDLFTDLFVPIEAMYQMVIPLFGKEFRTHGDGYAINRSSRDRDFEDRALDLASLLQPILIAHHRRLPAWGEQTLTLGQVAALRLVRRGLSLDEIAEELRCSKSAVKGRIARAREALGVPDRKSAAVAREAYERGLLA